MENTKSLKKNYEIKNVIKYGKTYGGHYLTFFILKNNKINNFLCISVTKKTGNSVIRNRIRRKIRENYGQLESKIKKGYSIVILWKKDKDKENATFDNIKNDFEFVFRKANIFNEKIINKND